MSILICLATNCAILSNVERPSTVDLRCGSYCLYVGLRALGLARISFADLEAALGQPTANGYSMGQLREVAEREGFYALGVMTSPERLSLREPPFICIARIDGSHFVLITDIRDGEVSIIDPPRKYELPIYTLRARWDGTALIVSPNEVVSEERLSPGSAWTTVLFGVSVLLFLIGTGTCACRRRRASV